MRNSFWIVGVDKHEMIRNSFILWILSTRSLWLLPVQFWQQETDDHWVAESDDLRIRLPRHIHRPLYQAAQGEIWQKPVAGPSGGKAQQRPIRHSFIRNGTTAAEAEDCPARTPKVDESGYCGDSASEQQRRTSAVLHVLHCKRWHSWQGPMGSNPHMILTHTMLCLHYCIPHPHLIVVTDTIRASSRGCWFIDIDRLTCACLGFRV